MPVVIETYSAPQAWIDSPLTGTTLPLGQVEIISHAASPDGIAQVELSINGAVLRSDANPNPGEPFSLARQFWLPAAGGTYQVSVRTQSAGGAWSAPASVTITILEQPSATVTFTATPTETTTPTQTATPTETPTREATWTPTPAGPLTIVLVRNSFCRTGPGQVYRDITALAAGDTAEVRGISADALWLFVYWPKFRVQCWIAVAAAPSGTDLSGVPALAAPPTPIPSATQRAATTPIPSATQRAAPTPPPATATPYKP
ncbi:MAG: hypothetical protein OHK0052_08750 [Anaerolineales bacterium]